MIQGLRLQQSRTPVVVPLIYGTARVPGNLIWFGDWTALRIHPKGFGKGGPEIIGYQYLMSYMLALCQGPVKSVNRGWAMGTSIPTIDPQQLAADWAIALGAIGQPPWGYFTGNKPGVAVPYTGICWVAQEWPTNGTAYATMYYESHPQDTMYQYTFEVTALLPFVDSAGNSHLDSNPADIIPDFLTSPFYGANVPPSYIGDLSDFRDYCTAYGLLLSPVFDHQQQAGQWLDLLLKITNSECRWSSGVLEIIPYTDAAQTGLGVTWTPNLTPVYSLTDDDFIAAKNAGPVQVQRKIPQDRFNNYVIEYTDRANDYRQDLIDVWSAADIKRYLLRKAQPRSYLPICDPGVAQTVAYLEMQRSLTVLNTYQFKLDQRYILLEPMDIVAITDVLMGLDAYPVRIVTITEDEDGELEITAEDLGNNFTPGYPAQNSGAANRYSGSLPAQDINAPMLFEPPQLYTAGTLQLLIGVSGGNGNLNFGGAAVWTSLDGATYAPYSQIVQPANQGFLTAALALASGIDTADTLAIALYDAGMTLESVSDALAQQGVNLVLVDSELIAFATQSVTGTGQYNLTYLVRGLYGTAPAAHAIGAPFCYLGSLQKLDPSILRLVYSSSMIGKTVYFKFTAFNAEGGGQQSLANVPVYTFVLEGAAVTTPVVQGAPVWVASTAYPSGEVIQVNGFYFTAQDTGTTGASAPTWPLGLGQTVTDGTVVWVNSGPAPSFNSGTISSSASETNTSPPNLTSSFVTVATVSIVLQAGTDPVSLFGLIAYYSPSTSSGQARIVDQTGTVWVQWDSFLIATGAYTTHVPLSAIIPAGNPGQGLLGGSGGVTKPTHMTFSLQALVIGGTGTCSGAAITAVDLRQ